MIRSWKFHFHHTWRVRRAPLSGGPMSTPMKTPSGFQMPAEWHPHRRCWMAWPTHAPAYFGRLEACKVAYSNVARAIARFEPVVMLANEADLASARTLCGPTIEVRPVPIDDGWFRDNGPTFVIDGRGGLLGVRLALQRLGRAHAARQGRARRVGDPRAGAHRARRRPADSGRRIHPRRRRGDPAHYRGVPAQPQSQSQFEPRRHRRVLKGISRRLDRDLAEGRPQG